MKSGMSKIVLVLAVLLLIGGIGYYMYESGLINFTQGENIVYEKNDMFFVTQIEDKYGISKSDGTQVLECRFNKILRNGNTVYLNDGTDSYVFFLDNNKSISLGGKESDVSLVYDKESGNILPYYILTYGVDKSSVYRIYTDQGVRYNNKDFTSYSDVITFLDAKQDFAPIEAPKTVSESYTIKSKLSYPTMQKRTQYIVSNKKENNNSNQELYGIVDETGRIVLDIACSNITELSGKTNGVVVNRNERAYLFLEDEKLLEVDTGFEFTSGKNVIYQKKGDTVNKVYNIKGEIIIDGIYSFSKDFYQFIAKDNNTFLVLKSENQYELYNVKNNQKYSKKYSELSVNYLTNYYSSGNSVWETGFIFFEDGIPYCVDFSTMKESRMNVVISIISPLDYGYIYEVDKK